MKSARSTGFTLVEVLVALGIVAIALASGLKAMGSLSRNAERQSDVFLAQLCAENELNRLRLTRQLPGIGDSAANCEQAGNVLQLTTAVRPTPNPNFVRIDARVSRDKTPLYQLSTVMGRF